MTLQRLVVYGEPQPKGSMKCVGVRGRGSHTLIEDDKTGLRASWRTKLAGGARQLHIRLGGAPIDGPVVVGVVAFVKRPKSNRLPHPITRSTGDVDKHARMTLDALTDGDVYTDDSRVVMVLSAKAWAEPGKERAVVFATRAHPGAARQVLAAMLSEAPQLQFKEKGAAHAVR